MTQAHIMTILAEHGIDSQVADEIAAKIIWLYEANRLKLSPEKVKAILADHHSGALTQQKICGIHDIPLSKLRDIINHKWVK